MYWEIWSSFILNKSKGPVEFGCAQQLIKQLTNHLRKVIHEKIFPNLELKKKSLPKLPTNKSSHQLDNLNLTNLTNYLVPTIKDY